MGKKKKLVIGVIAMSIVGAMAGRTAVYQCLPCGLGTYSDGTLTSCASCPEGKVCPAGTGTPFDPSSCRKVSIQKLTTVGSGTFEIPSGIYMLEVAAGGGGGGGTYGDYKYKNDPFNYECCSGPGGAGGNGELVYSGVFHLNDSAQLTYTVGGGGDRGDKHSMGGDGGNSRAELVGVTISAKHGEGGKAGGCSKYPDDQEHTGNGLGGKGGSRTSRDDCNHKYGSYGSPGWVEIFQLYDCK